MAQVLKKRSPRQMEVYCYDDVTDADEVNETMHEIIKRYRTKKNVWVISGTHGTDVGTVDPSCKEKDFKKMRSWVVNNMDTEPAAIFRGIYDSMDGVVSPNAVPQLILVLADYQYKAAFVADAELNMVACLTENMANVEFV